MLESYEIELPLEADHIAAGFGDDWADSCQGDSGGPLLLPRASIGEQGQDVQVGIVSYGATQEVSRG